MEEAYRQARKRGEQGRRRAISQSEHPYLTDLDGLVAQLPLGQRESVGLRDIPLEMVVGTVTKGRQSAFSCNFMPLLPFNTEFARKWSNLYDIQVTEGYRDPIIVTEFMHRFYVQEGNKRVSVLKFLDALTVSAKVTRLYPGTWDSVESRLYGEFCAFWRVCPLYEIEFSREGSYETLAKMLGQNLIEKWPQKKVDYLRHTFLLFKRAYLRAGGDHLDITPADAMLVYLNVYNQDRLLDTPTDIVVNRLCKIWRELVITGKMTRTRSILSKHRASMRRSRPPSPPPACSTSLWARPFIRRPTPCASPLSMNSPAPRRAGTACTTKDASISTITLAASCAPRHSRTATIRTCSTPPWKRLSNMEQTSSSRPRTA